ncbi:MAG TPA: hypothetical protein VE553_06690 [Candidatus Binatia bacterium]|jgi:hypothetical protein|nr:hypothetical protein [Candidatus Binatia bacterium]
MEETTRRDIRRLLKTFGVQADEALSAYLAQNPHVERLRVRVTLEDLTDYGSSVPEGTLELVVEDEISGGV